MVEKLYDLFLKSPKICIDSRKVEKNAIFFALKGPNFNANALANKAIEEGCSYAVIDEKEYKTDDRYILVDNVLQCLQDLAGFHRHHLDIHFIAITGSNGKTTTKELVKAVLNMKYITTATEGNLNNHIGVPLTVLSVTGKTEIAIIEMGANHTGEIARLCQIAQPGFGIITNIGKAHLEGFGNFEGVIKAKSELYGYLREKKGTVFINNDNSLLVNLSGGIKKISYGKTPASDYIGKIREKSGIVSLQWKKKEDADYEEYVNTQIFGAYNFENILCAIAVGDYFGVRKENIKEALENYSPSNKRSQLLKKESNTLIIDCYNANPVSMSAALSHFAQIPGSNKIAILGDMLELGEYSTVEHNNIVEQVKNLGFLKIYLIGKEFSKTRKFENTLHFESTSEAKQYLQENKIENSLILLKGSRGIRLESLVEVL